MDNRHIYKNAVLAHNADAQGTILIRNVQKRQKVRAMPVCGEFPDFLEGANIWRNVDGSWTLADVRGEKRVHPGEGFWIKYGETNGRPNAGILRRTDVSFWDYKVCGERFGGPDLGFLYEFPPYI